METINQEINPNHFTDYSNSDYNDCSINEEQEENIYDSINEEQKIDVNGGCNGEQKKTSNAQDNAQNDVHTEDNAQEQEGRFSYSEIHDYLASQKYPIGFSKADKLALRKRSKFFQVKDGHLYYTGKLKASTGGLKLVIENTSQRMRIISSIHDSSHLGVNRSIDMVSRKYYWPGLTKDVRSYVESCEKCQRNNKKLHKQAGALHPIVVEPKIWHQVGMDLIGPLKETPRGNKYIVTLTDYFSKCAEAAPLPDKCALGVSKFIYSVMCRYGCPNILITDQGREFVNEMSAQLYAFTQTEHRITSAYHPQTNGLTERFNQTLSRCLAKVINDDQTDWDEKLDTVLMGYRASRQASTKHSPYYLFLQKEMRLPIDSEILGSQSKTTDPESDDIDETVATLLKSREGAFTKAKENIDKAQKSQKETYDRKHVQGELSVGTRVLLENTAQKQRKSGKMDPVWLGPYRINRSLGKGLYELKNDTTGEILKKKVNVVRLKLYISRDPATRKNSDGDSPQAPKRRKTEDCGSGQGSGWISINGYKLTVQDRENLLAGQWLSDLHVHAAQLLMKRVSDVGGFQDPVLGQNFSFKASEGEIVQVLHSGGNHWLTVSTVGVKATNVIRIYDSLGTSLPSQTRRQIANLMKTMENSITIEYANVQKQPNSTDCGLFSIANAMAIINEQEPELLNYDVGFIRRHLAGCLEDQMMRHFPATKRSVRRLTKKTETMGIYCVCRMPEEGGERMIRCDTCKEWYHDNCVFIPKEAWKNEEYIWNCSDCSNKL